MVATGQLRDYQRECLAALLSSYKRGRRRVLVSLPTGTGKTVVFSHFPEFFRMKKRLLVLAHREELLEQARLKFLHAAPGLSVGIEQGTRRAAADAKVVVASVPTLGRANSSRLKALDPEDFFLIVVDEAHHAVAQTYRTIFDYFRLFEPDTKRLLVGFAATPGRGDGQDLEEVFEEIVYAKQLPEMVRAGFLSRIRGWRVRSGIALDEVRTRHGDFVEAQLASTVNTLPRNALLLRAYNDFGRGRRGLVFCVNVAHAHDVAEEFNRGGIRTAAVWGDMSGDAREETLSRFHAGQLDVLTNCNVLTEGFDEPRVDCVILARPTQSRLLYAQMVGRGTRLHPEKQDLVVIDVVDNTRTHRLIGLEQLFDLPEGFDLGGGDALFFGDQLSRAAERYPWIDTSGVHNPQELNVIAEQIDLFRFDPPDEVVDHTSFAWRSAPGGAYRLSLSRDRWMSVTPNLLRAWEVRFCSADNQRGELLGAMKDLPSALHVADQFVHRSVPDSVRLAHRGAAWRDEEPTEKQLHFLHAHKVPVPDGLTRGQVAFIIDYVMSRSPVGG